MNKTFIKNFALIALFLLLSQSDLTESYKNGVVEIFNELFLKHEKKVVFSNPNKLVCFYVFTKSFSPKIMEGLCTHITVGFFGISKENNSLEVPEEHMELLHELTLLKENAKDLKIIISVGGAGETGFISIVKNHTTRKMFIRSCMDVIKKFKIDGIDFDWEWPVVDDGNHKEKIQFVQLLQEIRNEFNRHKKKYILSVDVPSMPNLVKIGFYVNYLAEYVDYVNVMCYDYHFFTKFYPFTGHNAPLYSSSGSLFHSSINESILFWISNSMPREKILLGIPTYGHTYELLSLNKVLLGAPAKGFGLLGHNGFADYPTICDFLKMKNTTVVFDDISKTPYAYNFPEWISYDDERSVAIKASYITTENLGGAMIFSVNSDDYNGTCKGNRIPLPLIRIVRNILFNEV